MSLDRPSNELSRGDRELKKILQTFGVTSAPPGLHRKLAIGETHAVETIKRIKQRFGVDITLMMLRCILETGDSNAGELRIEVMHAVTNVLANEPEILNAGSATLEAFDQMNLGEMRLNAQRICKNLDNRARTNLVLTGMIYEAIRQQWTSAA